MRSLSLTTKVDHQMSFPPEGKAFDSLRCDYLDAIMEQLVFGNKWRMWIVGCLKNSRASILVNGSPTSEFELSKGLRQGDHMSPFQMYSGEYLGNQRDPHLQKLLEKQKNHSDTIDPNERFLVGQVYWLSNKEGCQSYHDNVMDQRPFPLYPHPV
uniref:Putative RNA-directed DNA polymerase, eukaryota, reverse transcriptase zinc-binding domain protein n=1 Tax=Tanacetum cinerariifolium TaxID=118510 RepID=A0A699GLX6_TANCI|nr:putative RNA-directed DNA polymerase, eukaryota, reverse transcriptase zinc-binding domain protein [Tanacetum cinerariifolium]